MLLSERMKTTRKRAGITQQELGRRLGVSGSMIGQWENGFRNPKYETVKRIAVALDVSAEYLLGRCDSPTPAECIEIPGFASILAQAVRNGTYGGAGHD